MYGDEEEKNSLHHRQLLTTVILSKIIRKNYIWPEHEYNIWLPLKLCKGLKEKGVMQNSI